MKGEKENAATRNMFDKFPGICIRGVILTDVGPPYEAVSFIDFKDRCIRVRPNVDVFSDERLKSRC